MTFVAPIYPPSSSRSEAQLSLVPVPLANSRSVVIARQRRSKTRRARRPLCLPGRSTIRRPRSARSISSIMIRWTSRTPPQSYYYDPPHVLRDIVASVDFDGLFSVRRGRHLNSKTIDPRSIRNDRRGQFIALAEGRVSCVSAYASAALWRCTPCEADFSSGPFLSRWLLGRRARFCPLPRNISPGLDAWIPEVLFPAHQDPQVALSILVGHRQLDHDRRVDRIRHPPDDADARLDPVFATYPRQLRPGPSHPVDARRSSSAPFPIAWPRFRRCGRCRSPTCRC